MPCSHCNEEKVFAKGFCGGCYHRLRRKGTLARERAKNLGRTCSHAGCERNALAKGLCHIHYDKQLHPLRNTWKLLRSRYPRQFPKEWDSFGAFLTDVGERPGPKHRLRRSDENKPFSAENVYWVRAIPTKDSYSREQRKAYSREWILQSKYKISSSDFDAMVASQGGHCAMCEATERLHVDHCHSTGVVRGVLCVSCNRGLGYFKDDPEVLRRAIAYLERQRTK